MALIEELHASYDVMNDFVYDSISTVEAYALTFSLKFRWGDSNDAGWGCR